MPQKKRDRAKTGTLKHYILYVAYHFLPLRINSKCLNSTGTKKKTVISCKDKQDILNKLDVRFYSCSTTELCFFFIQVTA